MLLDLTPKLSLESEILWSGFLDNVRFRDGVGERGRDADVIYCCFCGGVSEELAQVLVNVLLEVWSRVVDC